MRHDHPLLTIGISFLPTCVALAAAAAVQAGLTERVSVSTAGRQSDNTSGQAALSADGRFVAFGTYASNLVPGDAEICDTAVGPASCFDILVRDRAIGRTVRVNVADDGTEAACPDDFEGAVCSAQPAISARGRYVAFDSAATNLVAVDTNGTRDIFVHDRDADGDRVYDEPGAIANVLVSVTSDGAQDDGPSGDAAITGDGRHVAFVSSARFVPGDRNLHSDVYVRDRDTDGDRIYDEAGAVATRRVSVSTAGAGGNEFSEFPALSADGRFVAFDSFASNLVPGDDNFARDVFVHDRDADADGVYDEAGSITTLRVSVSTAGEPGNSESAFSSISADGRFVAFSSWASNLVPDDGITCTIPFPSCADVFVHDRDADADGIYDEVGAVSTTRLSLAADGMEGDGDSQYPEISGDGRYVAFQSDATNLVAGDDNRQTDVFLHDRDADGDGVYDEPDAVSTTRVSVSSAGAGGNLYSENPAISRDGSIVTFESLARNLVPLDRNGATDVFVHAPAGSPLP